MDDDGDADGVLESKRHATRYRILVEIAERQPAVNQREIADAIGVTSQAVSHYLQELVERGFVEKEGRGRYEVTKEGVDWLIRQTEDLREYTEYVSEEVVGGVDTESVLADGDVEEGERVALRMEDGVIHAEPGGTGAATAVAVSSASAGEAVAVSEFDGILDYEPGEVKVVSVPAASRDEEAIDVDELESEVERYDVFGVAGTEAEALARRVDREPDVRFGVAEAVREAAAKGVSVYVVAAENHVSEMTDALSEDGVGYEISDAAE